jgi:hypothetical protein
MVNCNPDAVLAADVVCLLMGDHTLIFTEVAVPLVATPEWLMKRTRGIRNSLKLRKILRSKQLVRWVRKLSKRLTYFKENFT